MQRFISEDPIGFWGGNVTFYAYTGNNPVKFTDWYGLIDYPHEVFPPSPAFVDCVKGIQEYAGSSLRKTIEEYDNCKKNCDEDIDNKAGCYVDDFLKSLLKATCKSECLAVYLKKSMVIHFEVWSWETGCFMLYQDPYGGGKEKDYRGTHHRE